jgi:peptide/nickel transport system substrate-binding protein
MAPSRWIAFGLLLAALVSPARSSAADLRVGLKAEINSADPHVLNPVNRNVWLHVYETLVVQDDKLRARPGLARGWRATGETTWEFLLRPDVRFHDGSTLTADDVKASIERAKGLAGPRTYRTYLKDVESVQVLDALKLQITTLGPSPNLPDNVSLIAILPKAHAQAGEEAFAKGAAIGTGPYRFAEWVRGERVVLARNDKYWGAPEPWERVVFVPLPKEPARAAALLSGSVDVIDGATASMSDAFARSDRVVLASTTSYWLNYLQFDRFRTPSPYIADADGKPLAANPLHDLKVRQAIHLAINREAIARHVMKGDAVPAGQVVPDGFFGHDPALAPPAADAARAKALLTQAGYPRGFRMTLHCTNDRYLNDARVCEAIGQMLSQAGLQVDVQAMPFAVFQTRAVSGGANKEPEFSVFMLGIGAVTGDSLTPLMAVTHTHDAAKGEGANNYGRYSNPKLDDLIDRAARTISPREREELQKAAARVLAEDLGIVPIHHLNAAWALRKGLTIVPRSDGFTFATTVREAKP